MAITTTTAIVLAATVVAAGATVAASQQQAKAQKAAARAQSEQFAAQAEIERQQALRERQVAGTKAEDFEKLQQARAAKVRAAFGARGVELSTGSPLLTSEDFAAETAIQAERIREGGEIFATRLEQRANLLDLTGRNALSVGAQTAAATRAAGTASAFGTLAGGGFRTASLLKGV